MQYIIAKRMHTFHNIILHIDTHKFEWRDLWHEYKTSEAKQINLKNLRKIDKKEYTFSVTILIIMKNDRNQWWTVHTISVNMVSSTIPICLLEYYSSHNRSLNKSKRFLTLQKFWILRIVYTLILGSNCQNFQKEKKKRES